MGLLTREDALERLVCPRCHAALRRLEDAFECSAAGCRAGGPRRFPIVAGQPALVDFDRSILSEESLRRAGGASLVPRASGHGPTRLLRGICSHHNTVAERHARLLRERPARPGSAPIVLVVGGGTIGHGAGFLYQGDDLALIAFDLYASPHTQFIADAHDIPLGDGSVDAVWVQAVLEHVLDPARVVAEIERVLTPDGLVYAETPFLQPVHEGAYDFTRFTESGHRWLFRRFERLGSGVVAGPGDQLVWSLQHAARALFRSKRAGQAVGLAAAWLRVLDRIAPEPFGVDGASCVYFFGRRCSSELTPREIVAHYQGAMRRAPERPPRGPTGTAAPDTER